VEYLYLHLAVLSMLLRGPGAWDAFVSLARTPYFLTLDVILLAGILIHGLNGWLEALIQPKHALHPVTCRAKRNGCVL